MVVNYITINNTCYCGNCFEEIIPKWTWVEQYHQVEEGTYITICEHCCEENITCPNVVKQLGLTNYNDVMNNMEYFDFSLKVLNKFPETKQIQILKLYMRGAKNETRTIYEVEE